MMKEERIRNLVSKIHVGQDRARLNNNEYVSAGLVSLKPAPNIHDENSRLRNLVTFTQQQLRAFELGIASLWELSKRPASKGLPALQSLCATVAFGLADGFVGFFKTGDGTESSSIFGFLNTGLFLLGLFT